MGGRGRGATFQQLRNTPWRGDGDASKVEQGKPASKMDEGGETSKVERSKQPPNTDEGVGAPWRRGGN